MSSLNQSKSLIQHLKVPATLQTWRYYITIIKYIITEKYYNN